MSDPFAAKRAGMLEEFYAKFFLLGGWLGATDTYKRTMWAAVPDIALARQHLRWEPKVKLRAGLTKTIEWFRSIELGDYRPPTPNY